MAYVSCMYAPELDEIEIKEAGKKNITCLDEQGRKWFLSESSQVGDYLEFIANGGTVEPYEAP